MPSFLASLESGTLRWDQLHPFPQQDPAEREAGEAPLRDLSGLLAEIVDPEVVDATRALPPELLDRLGAGGFLRLAVDRDRGGLELSPYNVFRVVERAARWSVPVGQLLGLVNGAGVAALLPVLPPGPLRDTVGERVAAGTVSGWADTEPTGQNNVRPATTLTPTADGQGYLLRGEKVFTGNGPVADLLVVTASLVSPDGEGLPRICLCFVDTSAPGFQVDGRVEFLGSRGLPNGALRFDDVHVPRDRVLVPAAGDIRQAPDIASIGLVGRLYIAATAATAIGRQCLQWQRDFVGRRAIDGRSLGEYDQVQRMVAATLSDVYAMTSVVHHCLIGDGLAERWYEQLAAKNLLTGTAWRIVDRTMSLMAAEGFETAESKRRRGVPDVPLERAFRDARGLRIIGNVDFLLDYQTARLLLLRHYAGAVAATSPASPQVPEGVELSTANQAHLDAVAENLRRFADTCRELVRRNPDPAALLADEHRLIALGRIANELFAMSAVIARAGDPGAPEDEAWQAGAAGQDLADVYCSRARRRLATCWGELTAEAEPDHAKISRAWLAAPAGADVTVGQR